MPPKAQKFLVLVCLVGAAALLSTVSGHYVRSSAPLWEYGTFVLLALVGGGKKITLTKAHGGDDEGSMSVGFAITFAAMLHLGPAAGIWTAAVVSFSNGMFPQPQKLHQMLFNICLACIESCVAGAVFIALNGNQLVLDPITSFPAIVAACLVYFAINTGGVATIIALCSDERVSTIWRDTFMWTAPSYFAGACAGAISLMVAGRHIGAALLLGSPIAYLTYQSYSTYMKREQDRQKHIEELEIGKAHLADLYLATIKSLALAIDAKDQYTHQHILRVQRYAVAIAKHMGLTGNELEGVNTGALLHDIGKLGVPEYVLLKPGRLTDDEFDKIKKHPEIGAAILDPVEFPWPVLPVVRHHHEKWDGTGYPDGLAGENIPLTARIMAVADVYDALTSSRSYRNAWTHERAVSVITKDAGTHFDPVVVAAFLEVIDGVVADMREENKIVQQPVSNSVETVSKSAQAAKAIQRASSELWAMYEVAQTLSSSLGLQETLDILSRKLEAIMPGTTCAFLLLDESRTSLQVHSVVGVNEAFLSSAKTLSTNSLSQQVLKNRETYFGEFDHDDLLLTGTHLGEWKTLKTAIIVPIVFENNVLGTINVYHTDEGAFSASDKQLLETISERAAMAIYNGLQFERTQTSAFRDSLTGLYNLRYATERVEEACHAGATPPPFALICVDVDSFKPLNDNFGHRKGDTVLQEISVILQAEVSERDIVARYGGDEFVILLADADDTHASALCERLRHAVHSYDPQLHHERLGWLRVDVSVGHACFPTDGADYHALVSTADARMYQAKTERKLGALADPTALQAVLVHRKAA
ncbi:MAG TPA: diguanylate cyclase [Capsulimonadaceae bacterium]